MKDFYFTMPAIMRRIAGAFTFIFNPCFATMRMGSFASRGAEFISGSTNTGNETYEYTINSKNAACDNHAAFAFLPTRVSFGVMKRLVQAMSYRFFPAGSS